jgi:hypothetical protein
MAAGLKGFDHLRQGGGDNGMLVKARFPDSRDHIRTEAIRDGLRPRVGVGNCAEDFSDFVLGWFDPFEFIDLILEGQRTPASRKEKWALSPITTWSRNWIWRSWAASRIWRVMR